MDLRMISQGPALKMLFFAHLVPVVWATQSNWLPMSYTLYNALFLVSILWSIHAIESSDAAFMCTALNLTSIVLDAVTIGVYYDRGGTGFNVFMAITNLLLRPLSSLVLLRFYNDRSGRYSNLGIPAFGSFGSGNGLPSRGSYEDIDRSAPHQSMPRSSLDTGSPHHQPAPNYMDK